MPLAVVRGLHSTGVVGRQNKSNDETAKSRGILYRVEFNFLKFFFLCECSVCVSLIETIVVNAFIELEINK